MEQAKKNTLSSLSGFPVKDALQGLSTGNRKGKPAQREQTIITPQCIIDLVQATFGEIIDDPCWDPTALTDPLYKSDGKLLGSGLEREWHDKAFINPPYKYLKDWLEFGSSQLVEQIWLVPNRTHRGWFRDWRDKLDVRFELNPIKFEGFTQPYPAPLLLGYWGPNPDSFITACFNSTTVSGGLYSGK